MQAAELRTAFLQFFQERGHQVVSSSSLVPEHDLTLLFTNAGMVQFKQLFLGEPAPYARAVSSQRCLRAGGKHNDLENVGYTLRHHTFFEMLGNFSFGNYFKREAIEFAWTFLTKILGIPVEKLWVTVFESDQEAEAIWLNHIGVDPKKLSRCGEKDNFWAMGDTGPCGPCSEIYYDHGSHIPGNPPGSGEEGDRYVEIWNLVFMQYNREADGKLVPLPKPSVDTGMGLERIAAVMQGVHSNYQTDLFQPLIQAAADLTHTKDLDHPSLKVLADHMRACAFLLTDGVVPSNEGRGYVLRRIMRRAIRHGHQLGAQTPFFHQMLPALISVMGKAYPELLEKQTFISEVIQQEEAQFSKTLAQGLRLLERETAQLADSVLPGEVAFKLYDTYGFPLDLTEDLLRTQNKIVDHAGFDRCMEIQRQRAREASQFQRVYPDQLAVEGETTFLGYESLETEAKVLNLFNAAQMPVTHLSEGETGWVVCDQTVFYAEAGGQVGDRGILCAHQEQHHVEFEVTETRKIKEVVLHQGQMRQGELKIGQTVTAIVEQTHRRPTAANHSATHLLHATLRKILGPEVLQKGSLVAPDRLRFDFAFNTALSDEQIDIIEQEVNARIQQNTPVKTQLMPLEQAKQKGAMALFGEKYQDQVRVLEMGGNGFSVELCGGTHVMATGDIGFFKIVSETGIAAGIRRIEALTGMAAVQYQQKIERDLKTIATKFKAGLFDAEPKVEATLTKIQGLEKALANLEEAQLKDKADNLFHQAKPLGQVNRVLIQALEGLSGKALRNLSLTLKEKARGESYLFVLGLKEGGKAMLSVLLKQGDPVLNNLDARDLIATASQSLGGKGGGRPDMAQLGSDKPEKLKEALSLIEQKVREVLTS